MIMESVACFCQYETFVSNEVKENIDLCIFFLLAIAASANVKYINCVRHTVMYLADLENMQLAFQGNN